MSTARRAGRLLGLLVTVALAGIFAQVETPGLFGKITSRPRAGDSAPEINYAKVLHNAELRGTRRTSTGRSRFSSSFPTFPGIWRP